MCYFSDCPGENETSSTPICALLLVLDSVRNGVPSWGQGHKGERSTLTGSQTILEVLWLNYLLDLNSYSHKINSVSKSGLSHLDLSLSREAAPPDSSSHGWKSYTPMAGTATIFPAFLPDSPNDSTDMEAADPYFRESQQKKLLGNIWCSSASPTTKGKSNIIFVAKTFFSHCHYSLFI